MAHATHDVPLCLACGARRAIANPVCSACETPADLTVLERAPNAQEGGPLGVLSSLVAKIAWVNRLRTRRYHFYDPTGRMGFAEVKGRKVHARTTHFIGKAFVVPEAAGAEFLACDRIRDLDESAIAGELTRFFGYDSYMTYHQRNWVRLMASWMGMLHRGEVELFVGNSAVWETSAGFHPHTSLVTGIEAQTRDDGELKRWSWRSLGMRIGPHEGAMAKVMPLARRLPRHKVSAPSGSVYRRAPEAARPVFDVQALDHRDRMGHGPEKVPTLLPEVVDPLPVAQVVSAMRDFWIASDDSLQRALRAICRMSQEAKPIDGLLLPGEGWLLGRL